MRAEGVFRGLLIAVVLLLCSVSVHAIYCSQCGEYDVICKSTCTPDPVCGDGNCQGLAGETCATCAADCGTCCYTPCSPGATKTVACSGGGTRLDTCDSEGCSWVQGTCSCANGACTSGTSESASCGSHGVKTRSCSNGCWGAYGPCQCNVAECAAAAGACHSCAAVSDGFGGTTCSVQTATVGSSCGANGRCTASGSCAECGTVWCATGTAGGTCCPAGTSCIPNGFQPSFCGCLPSCSGKACGSDGCGGTCGTCPSTTPTCNTAAGTCSCTAGSCGAGKTCDSTTGSCVTTPTCTACTGAYPRCDASNAVLTCGNNNCQQSTACSGTCTNGVCQNGCDASPGCSYGGIPHAHITSGSCGVSLASCYACDTGYTASPGACTLCTTPCTPGTAPTCSGTNLITCVSGCQSTTPCTGSCSGGACVATCLPTAPSPSTIPCGTSSTGTTCAGSPYNVAGTSCANTGQTCTNGVCTGTITCASNKWCGATCCPSSSNVCYPSTTCCAPDPIMCANRCGTVVNNCGQQAQCGGCDDQNSCTLDSCDSNFCKYVAVMPSCPTASNVECGRSITSTNGCGTCTGTGTRCAAGSSCNGNTCVPDCTDACTAGQTGCEGLVPWTCGEAGDGDLCLDKVFGAACSLGDKDAECATPTCNAGTCGIDIHNLHLACTNADNAPGSCGSTGLCTACSELFPGVTCTVLDSQRCDISNTNIVTCKEDSVTHCLRYVATSQCSGSTPNCITVANQPACRSCTSGSQCNDNNACTNDICTDGDCSHTNKDAGVSCDVNNAKKHCSLPISIASGSASVSQCWDDCVAPAFCAGTAPPTDTFSVKSNYCSSSTASSSAPLCYECKTGYHPSGFSCAADCTPGCTLGAMQCSGNDTQVCQGICPHWVTEHSCSGSTPVCVDSICVAKECLGTELEICERANWDGNFSVCSGSAAMCGFTCYKTAPIKNHPCTTTKQAQGFCTEADESTNNGTCIEACPSTMKPGCRASFASGKAFTEYSCGSTQTCFGCKDNYYFDGEQCRLEQYYLTLTTTPPIAGLPFAVMPNITDLHGVDASAGILYTLDIQINGVTETIRGDAESLGATIMTPGSYDAVVTAYTSILGTDTPVADTAKTITVLCGAHNTCCPEGASAYLPDGVACTTTMGYAGFCNNNVCKSACVPSIPRGERERGSELCNNGLDDDCNGQFDCEEGSCASFCGGLHCDSRGGERICSGMCVNIQSNNKNCGACGESCGSQEQCIAGKCTLIADCQKVCDADNDCNPIGTSTQKKYICVNPGDCKSSYCAPADVLNANESAVQDIAAQIVKTKTFELTKEIKGKNVIITIKNLALVPLENVTIVANLNFPKEMLASATDLSADHVFSIIKDDPVISFSLDRVSSKETIIIELPSAVDSAMTNSVYLAATHNPITLKATMLSDKDVTVTSTIVKENGKTKLHIGIDPHAQLGGVRVPVQIPKCIAQSAKELNLSGDFSIIQDDPLVVWTFTSLEAKTDIEIDLGVNAADNCKDGITAFVVADSVDKPINPWMPLLIIPIIGIILVFFQRFHANSGGAEEHMSKKEFMRLAREEGTSEEKLEDEWKEYEQKF